MAALAIPTQFKAKKRVRRNHALDFIDGIESSWKGHERFAMWLVQRLKPKTVVDLGFDRGLSTVAFAYKGRGHVFGVDWFEEGNYADKCIAWDVAFGNVSNALRFNYVKNVHLIVGPFRDIARKWKRKVDILHIDWAHSYESVKQHYDNWSPYLNPGALIIIHDVVAFPDGAGRFFQGLPFPKVLIPHSCGLGIVSTDSLLVEEIRQKFCLGTV